MKKAYIITQGSYSNYKVLGIASSEELAKQACERYNSLGYAYEEMEYEELDVDVLPFVSYYKVYTASWYNNPAYDKRITKFIKVFSSPEKPPLDTCNERGVCTFSTISEEDAVNKLKQLVKEKFNKDIQ